jgi:hypothetical protein
MHKTAGAEADPDRLGLREAQHRGLRVEGESRVAGTQFPGHAKPAPGCVGLHPILSTAGDVEQELVAQFVESHRE